MAQDVLTLDEKSFARVIDELSQLAAAVRKHYDEAVADITSLSGQWHDEDYQQFAAAFKSYDNTLNELQEMNKMLIATAHRKVEMIEARCRIEM